MKLLAEITEASLGLAGGVEKLGDSYELRKSARAVLLNEKGEVAVQYLEKYTFHKLPGGGVELGETIEEALVREVKEEVGCLAEILNPIGVVIEYRNKYNLLHISYAYTARVVGEVGEPALEAGEQEEGQKTLWLPPDVLFEKMTTDIPGKFEGYFILARERAIVKEFLQNCS
jgi:ADP-ribose pyrophosphatase YjhB (NUDIX family)